MEKVVALLLGDLSGREDLLTSKLVGPVSESLRERGATKIQVNVVDPDLGAPHGLVPGPDSIRLAAAISYWVQAAGETGFHADLVPGSDDWAWHSYLVSEALQLKGPPPPPGGGRSVGFTQLVPLTVPAELSWADWRRRWQGSHTTVAIETQSSFRYVQNLVVRPLNEGAPAFAAVVEESFPLEAAKDPTVFYDSEGDDAKYKTNLSRMLESCAQFMAGEVPIVWTAEYRPAD